MKMKDSKKLLKQVEKIVDIPKTMHPGSSPEDALKLGQKAGVVRIYAQNGAIWDIILADGSKKKIHEQDLAIAISTMILDANEKTKELPKVEPALPVEEKASEEIPAPAEELAEAEKEIAKGFEEGTVGELLDDIEVEITDAAAQLAEEHDIELAKVKGSGENGKILKKDIEALLK